MNMKEIYSKWKARHSPCMFSRAGAKSHSKFQGYDEEETFFIRELANWRSMHHRIPSMKEVFYLAIKMGYKKDDRNPKV